MRQHRYLLTAGLIALALNSVPAHAVSQVLIVQGLSGEAWYARQFSEQVDGLQAALEKVVGEKQVLARRGAEASRKSLLAWFEQQATTLESDDQLLVFLIGHGTYDGEEYKFNIPGPDLTGTDLQNALDQINAGLELVVNTSSSSGALLEQLSGDDRLIITATKNGRERNATRFGRFLLKALTDTAADLDKNRRVSVQEAFDFADRQTRDYYETDGLLATEHARLQGERARAVTLARLDDSASVASIPGLQQLMQQRDLVDREIETLRMRRIGMSDEDYQRDFQYLMLELIAVQDEIEALQGVQE